MAASLSLSLSLSGYNAVCFSFAYKQFHELFVAHYAIDIKLHLIFIAIHQ